MNVEWKGPFGWPKINHELPTLPECSGVYLITVDYSSGYLIYASGITRRSFHKRFVEHTRMYLNGTYSVLDIDAMRNGERKAIWEGFWMRPRPAERELEYFERRSNLEEAAIKQLAGFRLFVAEIDADMRILERIEAAVMKVLYAAPQPFSDIPDRGMRLIGRRDYESPISIINSCESGLHCLPERLEI